MKRISKETYILALEAGYNKQDLPPYQVELCDWLRENKGIHVTTDISYKNSINSYTEYFTLISSTEDGSNPFHGLDELPDLAPTHERALEIGLQYTLKHLNNV